MLRDPEFMQAGRAKGTTCARVNTVIQTPSERFQGCWVLLQVSLVIHPDLGHTITLRNHKALWRERAICTGV